MGKAFKILSIDGGGIKGLYSARILQHLESVYNCTMSDYFDLLCGTSTGGIIAMALSLRRPASQIADLYMEKGEKIFPLRRKILGIGVLRQVLLWGKYSDKPLRNALQDFFKEAKIGDSNNLICIPSYSVTDARNFIFRFDHKEGKLTRDNDTSYVDVALATSAAPTYFPLSEIAVYSNKQFIDGGIWSNNPCLVGLTEALRYFVGEGKEYDSIEILSISSLNHTGGKPVGLRRKRSFLGWKGELFDATIQSQSDFTHFFMSQLSNSTATVPIKYVRIPSELLSPEQSGFVKLDNAQKRSLDLISGKGKDRGDLAAKEESVSEFFKSPKTYKTK